MSVFGIVVEGPRDAAVYPAIIRKIRPEVRIVPEACGGVHALRTKFVGWLKYFQYMQCVDKVLVIRDCDRKDPHIREAQLRDRLDKSGFRPAFPVHFYATKSMVETWLLADLEAIREVARRRGHEPKVKEMKRPLEEIDDAKMQFEAVLSEVGLPADDKVYEEIASAAEIGVIEGRCPYFLKFREQIHAC